jgi:hypothetical protein
MYRLLPALLIVLGLTIGQTFGEEVVATGLKQSNDDSSTLRLYSAPELAIAQRGKSGFKPEVARLYVDDLFVGNAIVNLHGHLPTLKFGAGPHTIRVELNDREFQSKITLLGRGSTQILFIDFDAAPNTTKQ